MKAVADARIWKVYKRVLSEGAAINEASPAQALHSLRKRCKTLRYLIEFFAPLYPCGKIQAVLAVLKRLQDNLGEYQDLHVHIELLENARASLVEHGLLVPESDTAISHVIRAMTRQGTDCRDLFRKRFVAFRGEGHQRMFKRLFKP